MAKRHTALVTVAASLVASAVMAQQAPPPFVMATYYRCDYAKQARADTLYKQVIAPLLDRQVKAGNLTGYGFSSHRIGGVFRRLETWTAPTLDKLITAQDAYDADLQKTNPKGGAEFDAVCGSHDDYIWNRVLGSAAPPAGAPKPAYSYSRYLTCDMAKENEADMIMETALASMMNKHVEAGHIMAWGWFTHNMGGTIRRILNWSGKDVMAVLNAEEMISNDIAANPLGNVFTAICNSHSDYVWQSVVAAP
jgi:hypothetical protein